MKSAWTRKCFERRHEVSKTLGTCKVTYTYDLTGQYWQSEWLMQREDKPEVGQLVYRCSHNNRPYKVTLAEMSMESGFAVSEVLRDIWMHNLETTTIPEKQDK